MPQITGAGSFVDLLCIMRITPEQLEVFLFAADRSKDEKLVRYYEDQLNFLRPDELATAKPFYDFTCKFMCHEITSLEKERESFFDNFNPNPDSV